MMLKLFTGALVCLTMMSTAYAETCAEVSVTTSSGAHDAKFTAARIKDGTTKQAKLICQYDAEGSTGITTVYKPGAPIKGKGTAWEKGDCAVTDGDAKQCSYTR
ncbi:hypothetical protein ACOI9X_21715 [Pseudomonas sp. P2757]|uniref:hypothetical protein n=1 Tax=unclassified Pseudomonas TaxID=196821 RepID=UPI003B5CC9FA